MKKRLMSAKSIGMAVLCATFFVGCSQEVKQANSEVAVVMKESVDKIEAVAMKQNKALTGHSIGIAKLIVDDLVKTQTFYETMFGMKELRRYDYDLNIFEEAIMGFDIGGATLALFAPNDEVEKPLKKPAAPLVFIYTPEFEALVQRIKDANYPVMVLMSKETGPYNIVIVRDPSGNAIEIFERTSNGYAIGGSKLMVDDRAAAEAFYKEIFDVTTRTYYKSDTYDEVIVDYDSGPFHALYQPLNEEAVPKSIFPQTAIYTSNFDEVLAKIEKRGLGYREIDTHTKGLRIIFAKDPSGNAIEVISRN
jgi:predicted enzyme related to lactoylglutathione lyase